MKPPTPIPHWEKEPDYFFWEAFDRASNDLARRLDPDATQQEALLAETDNFYVIPDQFGVVSGHVLVLPKKAATSIAKLEAQTDCELDWLLRQVSALTAAAYNARVVVAEHGECGSVKIMQAHIHVAPIPATIERHHLRSILDYVLQRRLVEIKRTIDCDTKFAEREDLRALHGVDSSAVIGRWITPARLPQTAKYPLAARTAIEPGRPYVYFAGPGVHFISMYDLGNQFVREVVSVAYDLPPGTWDRWVNPSRDNMFATFARLAPLFARSVQTEYGFRPRCGV